MRTSGARKTGRNTALRAGAAVLSLASFLLPSPRQPAAGEGGPEICLREDFDDLQRWKPLTFPKIGRHSSYGVSAGEGGGVLEASSDDSASGIVYEKEFDIYRCPRLRWRWKVSRTYSGGDATRKSGDDYPARLYIIFPYDPSAAGFGERIAYGAAKAIYGEYPPRRALNYIWANRPLGRRYIPNAYTERAMMIPLRGPGEVGEWVIEEVDLLRDYREAFGEDPPARASLAFMNDGDDTGESSVSWVDFIELHGPEPL